MHVVVVEDEEVAARRLIRLVSQILDDRLQSVTHETDLSGAQARLSARPVDSVFLDLNLHGEDGFRLLGEAAAASFQTIVVSAQADEALRAFEFGVTDFVAKPFDEERLRQAIRRVTDREASLRGRLRYLAVKKGPEVIPVAVAEVAFIQGADDYSELHCLDGSRHLHGKTLRALERLLPETFLRVHRSYIANTAHVAGWRGEPGSRYVLRLTTGQEIPVSRRRVRELRKRLS